MTTSRQAENYPTHWDRYSGKLRQRRLRKASENKIKTTTTIIIITVLIITTVIIIVRRRRRIEKK